MAKGKHRRKSHSGILGERSGKEKGELHMKKHNVMRVASAMAVVTLLSTSLISGTLAKYVSTKTSTGDTATVAKWSVKAGSDNSALNDITGTDSWTFDVFNTVRDTDGTKSETDVAEGKIAPGTSGYVDLYVKNESEVTATYDIGFKSTNTNDIPLKYAIVTITGNNATRPADDAEWKSDISTLIKSDKLAVGAETVGYRLYWKWDIGAADTVEDETNKADTKLGTDAQTNAATATVTATVTATQVD